ncbi:MAG: flagellar hook-associated protein FlgK [Syntrophobacteraceae bacterium]
MPGLSYTLEIAKGTISNTQSQIQTISHNIANADSKTYARQKTVQVTGSPVFTRDGWFGTGATIDRVVQQRDQYVERRLMDSISKEADYKARFTQFGIASDYLSDDGENGISKVLGQFWDSWDALSLNPTGAAEQMSVQQNAEQLASVVRQAYTNLVNNAREIESQVQGDVTKVNSLLTQIAEYNGEIVKKQFGGQQMPNDLLDMRYKAVTDLAELIPIKYTEQPDGSLTVELQNSSSTVTLVDGTQAGSLAYDQTAHSVTYTDALSATGTYLTAGDALLSSTSGAEIHGLLAAYTAVGTEHDLGLLNPNDPSFTYLDRLNAFAATLVTSANTANNVNGGTDVFDASLLGPGFNAGDLLAATGFVPNGAEAVNIADLQRRAETDLGGVTLGQYLSGIQNRIGLDQQQATTQYEFQSTLRSQLEREQQAAAGVSIDEEMVDLLKQQQIYQAAAKLITHTAEMLNAVINMV